MHKFRSLSAGDPAPIFTARSTVNPQFKFDTAAGRYILLCFLGTVFDDDGKSVLHFLEKRHADFDDQKLAYFGVVAPGDAGQDGFKDIAAKFRFFIDDGGAVSTLYGAMPAEGQSANGKSIYRRQWVLIDPMLRVRLVLPFSPDGKDRDELESIIDSLPPLDRFAGFDMPVPVLVLPNVFERELCDQLIGLYEKHGGEESGFMREVDGKTVAAYDHQHKRRADFTVTDPELIRFLQAKVHRRVVPEIQKVHQFKVTRMERYIVGCYDAASGGHFRSHRDNTTKGTAHRRFALSINLNDDFEGGEVGFPEYGPRSFKAPAGGGVVFSCSLLHAVSPVTKGRRYAFLPFLYDDEAAKIREANNAFLGEGVGAYRS